MAIHAPLPEPLEKLLDAARQCIETVDKMVTYDGPFCDPEDRKPDEEYLPILKEHLPVLAERLQRLHEALAVVEFDLPRCDRDDARSYHGWVYERCQSAYGLFSQKLADGFCFGYLSWEHNFGMSRQELAFHLEEEIVEARRHWHEPQSNAVPNGNPEAKANNTKRGNRGRPPGTRKANDRIIEHMAKCDEAIYWDSPQWAEFLHCDASTVRATAIWKQGATMRERLRDERKAITPSKKDASGEMRYEET
jgi:hypothetical protein